MKIFNIIYNVVAITITLVFLFTVGVMATGTHVFAVATPSMETQIPEGSLVFVRQAQEYSERDVITARLSNGNTFTHRIISVDRENQLVYTKGDANKKADDGYRTKNDISGVVNLRIKYLGYPTLWIRSLFN